MQTVKVCENAAIEVADPIKGLVKAGVGKMVRSEFPPRHIHFSKDLMLPALVRVGAVTTRSRELYAVEGIPFCQDTRVLEETERTTAENGSPADRRSRAS